MKHMTGLESHMVCYIVIFEVTVILLGEVEERY